MARFPSFALAASLSFAMAIAACGSGESASTTSEHASAEGAARSRDEGARERPGQTVLDARCPPEAGPGCAEASGRVVFVEAVDPDGDGDAHFVILDSGSITLPGLTAIDVRRGLRPEPLPRLGDLVSAAGPVQTGSEGQSQIHALVFNVGRRR